MCKEHVVIQRWLQPAEEAINLLYTTPVWNKEHVNSSSDMRVETCHPGIAYILQLYTGRAEPLDTVLTHNVSYVQG